MTDLSELKAAPPDTNLPNEAFAKAAADYWASQKNASDDKAASAPIGVAAEINVGAALLDDFLSALDHPVLHPVAWPETVPIGHPLRSKEVFVKLWTSDEWKWFWELFNKKPYIPTDADQEAKDKAEKETGSSRTFWYVIAISACDKAGTSLWDAVEAQALERKITLPVLLEQKYNGPKGDIWAVPLWQHAMQFNGVITIPENEQAKNSDSTTSSTSSAE